MVFSPRNFLLFVLVLFSHLLCLSKVVWSLLCQASFWLGHWMSPPTRVPRSQPGGWGKEQLPLAPGWGRKAPDEGGECAFKTTSTSGGFLKESVNR